MPLLEVALLGAGKFGFTVPTTLALAPAAVSQPVAVFLHPTKYVVVALIVGE
jgi:hypothetical protein